MLPTMVTCWGTVCTLTGLAHNYKGLLGKFVPYFLDIATNADLISPPPLALRFFLGALEGGLLPRLILYLSTFYRRKELQMRISLFISAASLSGAFSGLLAAAIIKMKGVGGQAGGVEVGTSPFFSAISQNGEGAEANPVSAQVDLLPRGHLHRPLRSPLLLPTTRHSFGLPFPHSHSKSPYCQTSCT